MDVASQSHAPAQAVPEPSRRRGRIALAVVWALSCLYVAPFVDRGWIPHDEGTIAQSAERVLAGELPHRDYDEGYTGGLTYLHTVAFRLFGVRLLSLRFVLLAFFVAFVPVFYAVARRMASPWLAGLLTLLGVAWSVPNYFASLPSWYNLFLATLGALALLKHVETGRRVWLFAAGLCAGISILFKIVGLYDVAAVLLFLTYREQVTAAGRQNEAGRGGFAFLAAKAAGGVAFLALLWKVFSGRDLMDFVHFVLPAAAIVCFLVVSEWRQGRTASSARWRELWRLVAPFLLGVLVPLALFAIPYARSGSLSALLRGVLLAPWKAVETARTPFPAARTLWLALPYAFLLLFPLEMPRERQRRAALGLALVLGVALLLAGSPETYRAIWDSARSLDVVAVLAGCWLLGRPAVPSILTARQRQQLFLLVCVTALVSLVQFPFAAPIYFCYAAPLVALAIAAIVSAQPDAPRLLHFCVLLFYLFFALIWNSPGYVFNLGRYFQRYGPLASLRLERAAIRVPVKEALVYERLVSEIQENGGGKDIYAGPDCPEVYFLAGYRNPTRSFFDYQGSLSDRPEAILQLLEDRGSRVVVLNRAPGFSRASDPGFVAVLRQRFPHEEEIGKFTLLWREPRAP